VTVEVLRSAICQRLIDAGYGRMPDVSWYVLDAIPDGWAKLDGEWIRLRPQQDYGDPNGGSGPLWTTEEA
jgi:hypothetical protein